MFESNGSITIFLSLSLTIIMALICTTLETIRLNGLSTHLDMAADSALDSMFASYDRDLMEMYGLLFLDGSGGNKEYSDLYLKNEIQEYIKYELFPKTEKSLSGTTIYPMNLEDIRILSTVKATDFGGNILEQEIVDYMKYKQVGDISDKLFGWKEQIEGEDDTLEQIEDAEKTLNETDWNNIQTADTKNLNILEHNIIKDSNEAEKADNGEKNEEIDTQFDSERYKEEIEKSIIHQAEEIKKSGFLKLVVPTGTAVSGAKLEKDQFPSATSVTEIQWENKNIAEKTARMVLYGEYILEFFPNFCSNQEKTGIQYEAEYILFGKDSDEENLKSCINRLLWIREGLNAAHILSSAQKMEEALVLATAIVGWTMIPPLVTAVQLVIVGVWAYGESLLDVRRLLSGKKVELIKSESTWQLGLNGLKDFFNGAQEAEKDDSSGLAYEDYIRILLLTMDKTEKSYRTMDMIQQNMQQISPNFEMKHYIYSAQICVETTATQLFLMLPGIKNIVGQRKQQYRIIAAVGRSY